MRRFNWLWVIVFFGVFVAGGVAWALPLPEPIREILIEAGRDDLIEKYEKIPALSPDDFLKRAANERFELLDSGFNGVVFRTESGRTLKFIRDIFNFHAENGGEWRRIRDYDALNKMIPHGVPLQARAKNPNTGATEKELLGTLIMAAFAPARTAEEGGESEKIEDELPDFVSEDFLAQRGKYIEGVPLKKILQSQKLREDGGYSRYDEKKLWAEIVKRLNHAEKILLHVGITFDTINPDNFLVSGPYDSPKVKVIDRELVRPSKETYHYYAERGFAVPHSPYIDVQQMVHWPLFPDHIVFSKIHWNLSYEQSLLYLETRYGFSREEATRHLARVPKAPVDFVPDQTDYVHIDRAHADSCNGTLHPPEKPEKKE